MVTLPLTPIALGTDVPTTAQSTIFSIHETAINLQVDGMDDLVSITTDPEAVTVTSVGCAVSARFDGFSALRLHRGDQAAITGESIQLGDGHAVGIRIQSECPVYTGRIGPLAPAAAGAADEDAGTIARRLATRVLAEASNRQIKGLAPLCGVLAHDSSGPDRPAAVEQRSDGFSRAVLARARRVLAEASGGQDFERALPEFVGLGPGFTPSGDDFVVGFLAARQRTGRVVPAQTRARIAGRAAGTTLAGATLLRQALRGAFPAYLRTFALAADTATAASADAVEVPFSRAAVHGASSGLDTLSGFAFGLVPCG